MRNPAEIRGTREERVAQFKGDAELMGVATKLVSEVIEKAKLEAMKRRKSGAVSQQQQQQQQKQQQQPLVEGREQPDSPTKRVHWHRRARGFFVRALAILCFRPRRATTSFTVTRPQTA